MIRRSWQAPPLRPSFLYAEAVALLVTLYAGFWWLPLTIQAAGAHGRAAGLLFYPAHLLVVAAALWLLNGASRRREGLPPRGEGWLPGARRVPLALLLLGLLALAIRWFFPAFDEREFALRGLGAPGALTRLLLAMPWAAATEELVYRSCQERLRPVIGPAAALGASAVAFALLHLGAGETAAAHRVVTVCAAGLGGLILAWLYEKTGCVGLSIVLHLAYNFLAIAQSHLHVTGQTAAEVGLFAAWIGGALLLAVLLSRKVR
jgi:membrane protease YdiL (CAAX protease family)